MWKIEVQINRYFITSVHQMTLNIVSSKLLHENINKHKDRGVFDLQDIKKNVNVFFYILNIFIL